MAYATVSQLEAYLADDVPPPASPGVERLLEDASRDVDRLLGPYPKDPATGLKLDPTLLTPAQRDALARATCAAAEHRLMLDSEDLAGAPDFLPAGLTPIRPSTRPPGVRVVEELAGFDLIAYSGSAAPSPELPPAA